MSNELETSLEAQEAELLKVAQQADSMGVSPDELDSISENTQEHADPAEESNEETDTETNVLEEGAEESDNDDSDGSGESTLSVDSSTNQNAEQVATKPTKAQKEEERRDRSWKKLEEEKAKFAREKAEWETAKLNSSNQSNPANDSNKLAKAFDDIAKQFEEEGDFDKADEARQKANELRSQQANPQQPSVDVNSQQFQTAWSANMDRALTEYPEMKDPNSEFGRNVQALLRAPDSAQFFNTRPDGIYLASKLTKMKMTAQRVPSLEQENATLREEIKKLRQGMGLVNSGSRNRSGESTPFDSLSLEEQEKILFKQAKEADRTGGHFI